MEKSSVELSSLHNVDSSIDDFETLSSLPSIRVTRASSSAASDADIRCFFCDEKEGFIPSNKLWQVRTFGVDARVRQCAAELQDADLLAKLAKGDMIAVEAHYHSGCLISLYNRAKAERRASASTSNDQQCDENDATNQTEGIVLGELIAYIDDVRCNQAIEPVFKLSELNKLYMCKLAQLGFATKSHSTRLKNRILGYFPDMIAVSQGRDVMLMFDASLGATLAKACQVDRDAEGIHLVRAAQIVRRQIFDCNSTFNGHFSPNSQVTSVPNSLLTLLHMMLEGPCIDDASETPTAAAQSIAQLIVFNSIKHNRSSKSSNRERPSSVHHSRQQETPLPLYVSLLLHSVTRKRKLVDKLFHLGLCVSYDRMLQVSTEVANTVCRKYSSDDIVCPLALEDGLFTLAAIDNIDHNPSSTTAQHSFHGTSISLMQNDSVNNSSYANIPNISQQGSKSIQALPASYTEVEPSLLVTKSPPVPPVENLQAMIDMKDLPNVANHSQWLNVVRQSLESGILPNNLSWSAYHANLQVIFPKPAVIALLPLFFEEAHSVAMIKHGMVVVKKAVMKLNAEQIPVIALDQPLYAMGKLIQWSDATLFGEDKFVLLLGGLHIELAAWKTCGDWLDGSGWTDMLVHANVTSVGSADSFLKASHIKRARQAHILTVAALSVLRHRAYEQYVATVETELEAQDFDSWCMSRMCDSHFAYWSITLQFALTILDIVSSIRQRNFQMYVASLIELVPWFFTLDHTHYARWLPVHIRDMVSLSDKHPAVAFEFGKGNFTVCKTSRPFSAIAVDHAHEQCNKLVKEEGGAIGLTGNEHALRRWMIAGPEVARMVEEFEQIEECSEKKHHEQTPAVQKTFVTNIGNVISTLEEFGNPFAIDSGPLASLQSKVIASDMVVNTVKKIRSIGQQQYKNFVNERLINRTVALQAPIKRNKFDLLSTQPKKSNPGRLKLGDAKSDCALFSRLYIASQSRDGNLENFFMHENQAYPPSLCSSGKIRQCVKSDLLQCLEKVDKSVIREQPPVNCIIVDGAAVVQMIKPGGQMTFFEYASNLFRPHIYSYLRHAERVDVVFDVYKPDSLKSATRAKRGDGVRRRVVPHCNVPTNWQEFLRTDDNKTELFKYLAVTITDTNIIGKVILATHDVDVVSNPPICISDSLAPCLHEEADTRMLLHAYHASETGLKNILLRTVDTDVVVIAIACFDRLHVATLWIAIGVGSYFRYIACHEIANSFGPDKSRALTLFHAFTGCDTVSSFAGRGKKSAFDTWMVYPDATSAFLQLLSLTGPITDDIMLSIERYVVLMYDRTSQAVSVNACRKDLFARKGRAMESIPPTRDALIQHLMRAIHQASHIWDQALVCKAPVYCPSKWGWELVEGKWNPVWMTLAPASQVCNELLKCGCKKRCSVGHCKCRKACLQCTSLCNCGGECNEALDDFIID